MDGSNPKTSLRGESHRCSRSDRTRVVQSGAVTLTDTLKQDVASAMKAGDRERVGTLRLVLSEVQKAIKDDPSADEQAVVRRERKRRLEAAEAFEKGGRADLAASELAEAELIAAYLPAEMGDDELRAIVRQAVADAGATTPSDMGAVMSAVMPRIAGRADGKRVSAAVRELLSG